VQPVSERGEQELELRMPRILLAEEDDVVRDMQQAVLERDGFEAVAAANAGEALSRTAKRVTGSPHCAYD
jgi:CheY-like chemotaxis protein